MVAGFGEFGVWELGFGVEGLRLRRSQSAAGVILFWDEAAQSCRMFYLLAI